MIGHDSPVIFPFSLLSLPAPRQLGWASASSLLPPLTPAALVSVRALEQPAVHPSSTHLLAGMQCPLLSNPWSPWRHPHLPRPSWRPVSQSCRTPPGFPGAGTRSLCTLRVVCEFCPWLAATCFLAESLTPLERLSSAVTLQGGISQLSVGLGIAPPWPG